MATNYNPNINSYGTSTNPVTGQNTPWVIFNAPDAQNPYGSYTNIPVMNTDILTANGNQPGLPPPPAPAPIPQPVPNGLPTTAPISGITAPPAPDLSTNSGILKRYIELQSQLTGQDVTALQNKVATTGANFDAQKTAISGNAGTQEALIGRTARLSREEAIALGPLNAELQAKVKPIEDQIAALKEFQTINNNDLTESQKLRLQSQLNIQEYKAKNAYDTAVVNAGIITAPTASTTYTVTKADEGNYALTNVAKAHGIDLKALETMNPQLNANGDIKAGDVLNLPHVDSTKSGVYTGNPTVDAWMGSILNGNATMAQVPKEYKNAVVIGLNSPQNGDKYSPLAASRFAIASNRIVSNFIALPQYALTANGLPYLQRIDAAIKTPGSISDQDLLDSLTKLNTAGNAVTDSQVKLITGYKSFGDMASTFANKFKNGGALSDRQRKDIQKIANNIYANYQQGYQPVYDQAKAQLTAAGIPEAFWTIPDLNKINGSVSDMNFKSGGSTDLSQLNFKL